MMELTAFQLKEMNVREVDSMVRLEMNVYVQIKLVELAAYQLKYMAKS